MVFPNFHLIYKGYFIILCFIPSNLFTLWKMTFCKSLLIHPLKLGQQSSSPQNLLKSVQPMCNFFFYHLLILDLLIGREYFYFLIHLINNHLSILHYFYKHIDNITNFSFSAFLSYYQLQENYFVNT